MAVPLAGPMGRLMNAEHDDFFSRLPAHIDHAARRPARVPAARVPPSVCLAGYKTIHALSGADSGVAGLVADWNLHPLVNVYGYCIY